MHMVTQLGGAKICTVAVLTAQPMPDGTWETVRPGGTSPRSVGRREDPVCPRPTAAPSCRGVCIAQSVKMPAGAQAWGSTRSSGAPGETSTARAVIIFANEDDIQVGTGSSGAGLRPGTPAGDLPGQA